MRHFGRRHLAVTAVLALAVPVIAVQGFGSPHHAPVLEAGSFRPAPAVASSAPVPLAIGQVARIAPKTFRRASVDVFQLPANAAAGDIALVAVDTPASSRLDCLEGARLVSETASGGKARIGVCLEVVAARAAKAGVRILPPAPAVTVTTVFDNVDTHAPILRLHNCRDYRCPSAGRWRAYDATEYFESSDSGRGRGQVAGLRTATVDDLGQLQIAAAVASGRGGAAYSATHLPGRWTVRPAPLAMSTTTIVLRSATVQHRSGALPQGSPTSTVPPSSTTTTTVPSTTTTTVPSAPSSPVTSPPGNAPPAQDGSGGAPSVPPAVVCGDGAVLDGPSSPPAGAVTVPAGLDAGQYDTPDTTYWFAPGVHTVGTGEYDQFAPGAGDIYVGGPGAVIDGQGDNEYAIVGSAADVTVADLTIEDFVPPGQEAAVNQNGAPGWTIRDDTVTDNSPGAGVMLGTGNVLADNCLSDNGQYAFQAYSTEAVSALTGGPSDITVTHNEIIGNDTYNWDVKEPGCGCSGGAKFWRVDGATVTDNYVADNTGVGLWVDTDNTGFTITGNYISGNTGEGVMYEISYNAVIDDNTFVDNSWPTTSADYGWDPALYVSESGGDGRVPGPNSGVFDIEGNDFTNNWGGVVLWENSNRFCSDGWDAPCTLVDPSVYTVASCQANLPGATPDANPDYFYNCRWRTQNVLVAHNNFDFDPSAIGPDCTPANGCGITGLFSEYGSTAPYKAWVIPEELSNSQNDLFEDNAYTGPWVFDGFVLGDHITWTQWTHGFEDSNGSYFTFNGQDANSTYTP